MPPAPPPPNPVLSAYESFVRDTPLVTRYTLMSQVVTFFLSFVIDPSYALSNIPFMTVKHFELYRIVLSPFVCNRFLSLLFAFISFMDNGKRLEISLGSGAFGWLIITLGVVTNVLFLLLSFAMYFLTGSTLWLIMESKGIWIILLGLIAIECSLAPADSKRRLFVFEVPTLYYPCALLVLFSLFSGGFNVPLAISVAVGYAYGWKKLEFLKVSQTKLNSWEGTGCLVNFASRPGWIKGHAASGASAWALPTGESDESGGGWTPTAFRTANGDDAGPGEVSKPKDPAKPSFPKGPGMSLGGTTRRAQPSNAARATMLEAAAARRAQNAEEGRSE